MDILQMAIWATNQAALNAQKPAINAPATPPPVTSPDITREVTVERDASLEVPPALEGEMSTDYLVRLALWSAIQAALNAQKPAIVSTATPGPMKSPDVTRNVTVLSPDAFGDMYWLPTLTPGAPRFVPGDNPSLYENEVPSSISPSLLGKGVAMKLTLNPVKPEYLASSFTCKLSTTYGLTFVTVELYSDTDVCQ